MSRVSVRFRLQTSILKSLAVMVLLAFLPQFVWAVTLDEVASQLICTCGCTMIVSDCNCGTADDMRKLVQSKIDQGMDKEGILNDFVSQYGEKVLAAPTKSGFNLTAWILPFVVLITAGVGVTFVIRTWVRSSEPESVAPAADAPLHDARDRERLQRELDRFDS